MSERILFDGCEVVVMAPEDLEAIELERDALRLEVAALAKGAAIFGCPQSAEPVRNCHLTKAEDYGKEACHTCWSAWAKQAAKAGKACAQCGKPVEAGRECYAIPTCYACLPPPEPLPVRKAAQAGKDAKP